MNSNTEQKNKFLEYFRQLPIQKLGAESIGVDQDTIINWKKKDKTFSDNVGKAKSEWALKHIKGVHSSEWLLERILRSEFSPLSLVDQRLDEIDKKLSEVEIARISEKTEVPTSDFKYESDN